MVCVVAAVSKSVVEHGLAFLLSRAGDADDVKDGDVFRECTRDTVGGAEFANTESSDKHTDAALLDSGIAIGSVRRVEFVAVVYR